MKACKCLNIIIETKENDLQTVEIQALDLQKDEAEDIFFKNVIKQAENLNNISRLIPGLVETREVGSWIIHYCINCKFHTHAVHKEKGASFVLVNGSMLDKKSIDELRQSENFSKVFGIVIDPSQYDDDSENEDTFYQPEVEPTVKYVKETLADVLKKEAALVEQKIKKFSEDEYCKLDCLREKSFNEEQALIGILVSHTNQKLSSNNKFNSSDNQASKWQTPEKKNSQLNLNNLRHTPKRQKSSPKIQTNDLDSEGLFEFDGLDDTEYSTNNEDSESEDETIGRIARDRSNGAERENASCLKIAKSLPMDIPQFMKQVTEIDTDYDDEDLPLEDNIDIAASIKKLAKSVHGGTVFGELPRPRFSTQL